MILSYINNSTIQFIEENIKDANRNSNKRTYDDKKSSIRSVLNVTSMTRSRKHNNRAMIKQLRLLKGYKEEKLKILLLRKVYWRKGIEYVYHMTLNLRNKSWWKPNAPLTQHTPKQLRCIRSTITLLVGRNEKWYSQFCTKMFDMPAGQGWTQETPRIINVIAHSWIEVESYYHGLCHGTP